VGRSRATGSSRRRARLVWGAVGGWLLLSAVCIIVLPAQPKMPTWAFLVFTGMAATLGIVGALIVTRQPRNAVGWILWLAAGASFVSTAASAYANVGVTTAGAALPGTTLAAWLAPIGFFPSVVAVVIFIPLLFPDGRYLGYLWRWVGAFGAALIALDVAGAMFTSGPLADYPTVVNPAGLELVDVLRPLLDLASTWGLLLVAAMAIASAWVRYRHGDALERTQLRWFGAAAGLTVSLLVLALVLGQGEVGQLAWLAAIISLTLIPIAIGIAVLRYRLYEIDRIISRTIGWAIVTGLLVGAFVVLVVGLTSALAPLIGNSTLPVAGATLVVAALFAPLRGRVQRSVDRRFDRSRYDGERLLAAFGERLRDEVDLVAIRSDVLATVDAAVRPASVGLWLRERSSGGGA
jgi:hypothetical protein